MTPNLDPAAYSNAELEKCLSSYIFQTNNADTRKSLKHTLEKVLSKNGLIAWTVTVKTTWENTPLLQRIWLWLFDRKQMSSLKSTLDCTALASKPVPLTYIKVNLVAKTEPKS